MSALNFVATLILVGITAWYAYSTAKMLREMKRQADIVREQSALISNSAQIAAWVGLTTAEGHPARQNPYEKLRQLVTYLEEAESARM